MKVVNMIWLVTVAIIISVCTMKSDQQKKTIHQGPELSPRMRISDLEKDVEGHTLQVQQLQDQVLDLQNRIDKLESKP